LKWTGTGILPAQMLEQSSPKKRTVEDNSRYHNSSPIHENNAQTTLNELQSYHLHYAWKHHWRMTHSTAKSWMKLSLPKNNTKGWQIQHQELKEN
jgi:hypothetical protein